MRTKTDFSLFVRQFLCGKFELHIPPHSLIFISILSLLKDSSINYFNWIFGLTEVRLSFVEIVIRTNGNRRNVWSYWRMWSKASQVWGVGYRRRVVVNNWYCVKNNSFGMCNGMRLSLWWVLILFGHSWW